MCRTLIKLIKHNDYFIVLCLETSLLKKTEAEWPTSRGKSPCERGVPSGELPFHKVEPDWSSRQDHSFIASVYILSVCHI